MPTSIISNTTTDPSGVAVAGVEVTATLWPGPGFRISDESEVSSVTRTTSNGAGLWSLPLEETANISPEGSAYVIEEKFSDRQGGPRVYLIQVGAVDATLLESLVSAIDEPSLVAYLTLAAADARYAPLAVVVEHPDLAEHDTLGLATQAELDAVAAAKANALHGHLDGDLPASIARDTEVTAAVDAHAAAVDPHAGYRLESAAITAADVAADVATQAELDAVAAAKANTSHSHVDADLPASLATDVEVAAAVAAHEAEMDPHPGYLTAAEGNVAYEPSGTVATHAAAADPHSGYRLESVPIAAADVAADVATQAELDAIAAARVRGDFQVFQGTVDPGGAEGDWWLDEDDESPPHDHDAEFVERIPVTAASHALRPVAAGTCFSSPCAAVGTFAFANGDCRFAPLFVAKATAIDRLLVNVTVAGSTGALTRLVLADSTASFKPGTVLAQGTVDSTSTGVKSLVVALTLQPGVYWVAAVNQGAPATNATLTFINGSGVAVVHESLLGNASYAWQVTGITGVVPDSPAVAAFFSPPRVAVRQA